MMHNSVEIVRRGLAQGNTMEEMQEAGVLDEYEGYAGSYIETDGWIEYIVDALTVPREERSDICKPLYEEWKKNGAGAAVDRYQALLQTSEQDFDFNEYILMSIGSKLLSRGLYEDSLEFLDGSLETYPDAEYGFYTHFLAAKASQKLSRPEVAAEHCRESLLLKPDFAQAASLMEELSASAAE
jgi:tetratricopeptide (TPR) repeat protein